MTARWSGIVATFRDIRTGEAGIKKVTRLGGREASGPSSKPLRWGWGS